MMHAHLPWHVELRWISIKVALIRLNRMLAWALLISPVVQIVFRLPLGPSLICDGLILLAHAILSLALFGLPKGGQRSAFGMYVMGQRPKELSPRNRFLFTGYRIALATLPIWCWAQLLILLFYLPFPAWPHAWPIGLALTVVLWLVAVFVMITTMYPLLRLPFSVLEHLEGALKYAMQRWRWPRNIIDSASVIVTIAWLFASVINLNGGLFR